MAGVKGRSGGHNRKTTQKLQEEGGYRTTRHANRVDILVAPAVIEPPSHLSEAAVAIWRRVLSELPKEVITKLDIESLTAYCDMVDLYAKTRPLVLADPLDKYARSTMMAALDRMDKLGRQFGWTPLSRAALSKPTTSENDAFTEWLKASSN